MKNSPLEQQEQLQSYLTNRMSSEDRQAFESLLKEDQELREELTLYKELQDIGKHTPLVEANHQIMEAMKGISIQPDYSEVAQTPPKDNTGSWWNGKGTWLVGLLIVGVVGGLLTYSTFTGNNVSEIVVPYMQPYENLISQNQAEPTPLAIGMTAYDRKDYPTAIQQLQRHLTTKPNDLFAQLYLGISHTLNGQTEEAINLLQPLTQSEGIHTNASKWYLALNYIQIGNLNDAKFLLLDLEGDAVFGERVKTLTVALNKTQG